MWHIKEVEMLRLDVESVVTKRQIKGNITDTSASLCSFKMGGLQRLISFRFLAMVLKVISGLRGIHITVNHVL